MRIWQIVKTTGKIIGIVGLCFVVLGFILGNFYEKEVKQLLIGELNKNLDTKISVNEFDFSLLRHFPNASFDLNKVVIEEVSNAKIKDTLLYSEKVSLLFNVMSLFRKDISVKSIIVTNGKINIRIDSLGHGNYHFWKRQNDTAASGKLDLEKIILKNIYLTYTDIKGQKNYAMLNKNAVFSGQFSSDEFTLKAKADMFVDRIMIHRKNFVDHHPANINTVMHVDTKTGIYTFNESDINIADAEFKLSGKVIDDDKSLALDLAINSAEENINSFIEILPANYHHYLEKYECSGKCVFTSKIKGGIDHNKTPEVNFQFTFKDGRIKTDDASFDKLTFSGTFDYSDSRKGILNIPSLTASISGHAVRGSLRMSDFPDAYIDLHAQTQLDLKEIRPFINADTLESLSGDLAMNIYYKGKVRELSEMQKGKTYNIKASGNIDIEKVNFSLKKNPLEFKNMTGNFELNNNDVVIKNFSGNISSTDFKLSGVFKNFVSFLLIPGQSGEIQARLTSGLIDLDELLVNKSATIPNDTTYLMKFNPRLQCNLDVNISKLRFRRFGAENISGQVNLEKQVITGRNLNFNAMGGKVAMDATINANRRDSLRMDYDAKFANVDITKLFYEMENFDQHTMTDKNVKGRISADVQFQSSWSNDLTLNSKSVKSTGNITIENGELINFAPIQALAKYIHADLNHIKFSTLKNNISIANRKIFIPHMDINSSAINISANGTHDFDNIVDYHLKLLLSDVLGKKVRNQSEFGEIEDDGLGHTKLFLAMKGPVDDPDFSYDRKAAGAKIKNDIVQERQNLKELFKQEFGKKSDPSVQVQKPKKREEMQIDWSEE